VTVRIALYASPLRRISKPTGVGQHIANMADRLAGREGVELSLLASRGDYDELRGELSERLALAPVRFLPEPERLLRFALLATKLVAIERWSGEVDWVYCPKEQPVATRRARLAVTVHDVLAFERGLAGLERPFRPVSSLRWRMIMRGILQRADLIATVSEFTRQRMIELFRIKDEGRLVVVGNGVAPCYFSEGQPEDEETLEQYRLDPKGYVITVGSLTFRKGGDLLLDLAQMLRKKRMSLKVVVTGRRHDAGLLQRYRAAKSEMPDLPLELPGYLPDRQQAALLRNALALVFPSRYEGFGIPVLEAMAAGTAVVCSRAAALPEVAGEAALFVDGLEAGAWLEGIHELNGGSRVRGSLVEAGRIRAREFTWERCASRLLGAMSAR
jgi:glycosyltransferase involved in cell wall biosynthesis